MTTSVALAGLVAVGFAGGSGRTAPRVASDQQAPAVAFDGTNFLVAWQDNRSGNGDIYGARVAQDGTVLDAAGIPIANSLFGEFSPAVAFDGVNYLVVWDAGGDFERDIYGARVTPSGTVLDPGGIEISTAPGMQVAPRVAFDGSNYLVVWQDGRSGHAVFGARVTPDGVVLDPGGISIASVGYQPALAFDGMNYLTVWTRGDIYGARVTPAGIVLDPQGIQITQWPTPEDQPAVAFGTANYLVAWREDRGPPPPPTPTDIAGARVTSGGTVLDPYGFPISTAPDFQEVPALSFDGTNYLAVWEDDRSYPNQDIYGARVSPGGVVLDVDGIPVSTAPSYQNYPALAFGSENHLVVWQDYRSGTSWDIYGTRMTSAGIVLDPNGIPISAEAGPPPPPPPPLPPAPPPPPPPPPPLPPPPLPPPPPPPPPVRCHVPRVIGLRLGRARTRIRRAHCSVGRIRRVRSRTVGHVIAQRPGPGRSLARGARISLTVGSL